MRRLILAGFVVLICSASALAKPTQTKPFNEVFDKVMSDYVSAPAPADLVRAAVQGMIKLAPQSPAVAVAKTKLTTLANNRNAALAWCTATVSWFNGSKICSRSLAS